MKKLLSIAIACLFAISTQAQNTPANTSPSSAKTTPAQTSPTNAKQAQQATPAKASHDQVMMRDGKLWVSKDGKTVPMTSDMTMSNGTKLMTDGSYTTKDGKKMKMKNGDSMNMDGQVMKSDMPKKAAEPKAAQSK